MKTKRHLWTYLEDQIIEKLYPVEKKQEILSALPNRTWVAIVQRAYKNKIQRIRHRENSKLKLIKGKWFSWHKRQDGYIGLSSNKLKGYKTFEHRYIWEQTYGTIPDNHEIHHIDGDRENNTLENLELVHRSKHHARDREIRQSMTKFLKDRGLYKEWLTKEQKTTK